MPTEPAPPLSSSSTRFRSPSTASATSPRLPGSNCGDGGVDCNEIYDHGTIVILTPTAGTGYNFTGFSGGADRSDGEVTMTADVACIATFTAFSERVVIFLDGFESGDTSAWDVVSP